MMPSDDIEVYVKGIEEEKQAEAANRRGARGGQSSGGAQQ